jgi:hypothetical protein
MHFSELLPNVFSRGRADMPKALGAAMPPCPPLNARSKAMATGCEGQRKPMLSCPPATASGMAGLRFKIMVRGPGQKARASCAASGGMSIAQRSSAASGEMWTIRGWPAGLPFAA